MRRVINFSCFTCLIVSIFLLFIANQSMATTYCVANESELIAALNEAKANESDDIINIQQGIYNGNFVYASAESFGVTIEGGYTALCAGRVVDPTNTILDGGKSGTVLKLSSPGKLTTFVVEGITLQNGDGPGFAVHYDNSYLSYPIKGTLNNNHISNNSGPGVHLLYVRTANMTNNTISNNSDNGVFLYGSHANMTNNTISGNNATYSGGGIHLYQATFTLNRNIIANNSAGSAGGGIFCNESGRNYLTNNTISGNNATGVGGGIFFTGADFTLNGNIITNNSAGDGGGVKVGSSAKATYINNIISNNSASYGGGVSLRGYRGGPWDLTNNTIINNSASKYGGGIMISGNHEGTYTANIYNNIIWNNNAVDSGADLYIDNLNEYEIPPIISTVNLFNNDFDQSPGGIYIEEPFLIDPSNLDNQDPLFVDPDNGDFHLTENSPCKDAGTDAGANVDIDGDARPHDSGFDIGADEYVADGEFVDVPSNYWAVEYIYKILNAGITTGCSKTPLKYCPVRTVTRDQMAVFLGRGIHGSSFTPPPETGIFDDVPVGRWAADWIEQFYKDGITTGCSKNPLNYCPGADVTRAQMAIFLLRSKHGKNYKPPKATGIFMDVPVNYWAADWIEQLYKEGITTGCKKTPLMYCPGSSVTRAQMAVFIVRTFGL